MSTSENYGEIRDCEAQSTNDNYYNRVENLPVPPRDSNKTRQIIINEVNRGYVVQIGCHTFAIETAATLISKLSQYINEPDKTEAKWFNKELF